MTTSTTILASKSNAFKIPALHVILVNACLPSKVKQGRFVELLTSTDSVINSWI